MTDAAQHPSTMRKDDWIKLAMPASITLLAVSIFTMPLVVQAMQTMGIEGTTTSQRWPVYVKILD